MKSPKGIVYKRKQKILMLLKEQGTVNIDQLSQQLNVSPITVRRDLQEFETQGLVERYYGGAALIEGALAEEPQPESSTNDIMLKRHAIAKRAAEMIEDGDTVFINSSSTARLIFKYLTGKHVVIITNNAQTINYPHDPLVELVLTGGEVNDRKQSLVGDFAINTLSKVSATKCFIGVSGISAEGGVTTTVLQETAINQLMVNRCNGERVVVADGTKVGRENNFLTCDIEKITHLITDIDADDASLEELKNKAVQIIQVAPLVKID